MYESDEVKERPQTTLGGSGICKRPTGHFGINFTTMNDFEKGLGVAIVVDGVLCTSKEAAATLITKRVEELYTQWAAVVAKM